MNRLHTRPARSRGIVMIDALIAIVIFSIGILGMIGLQAAAVKMAGDAKYRSDAAMFADQIIAQMWGDDPKNLTTTYAASGTKYKSWAGAIAKILPGIDDTTNVPTISVGTNNLVTVTVNWKSPNDTSAHSYVSITQITR
ncbi:MAG: hypothetical protein E6K53_15455 [Gammaproteobacteria bacterium]|nr:MAG: hypothetical protein E6K53_15455 [Gammaproteobacteria bacterium]